jgi:glucosamine--fructose-6-phosphate aminotransferase (isomerizing)
MCGIVGYIGPRETAKVLIEGLKRLEYRGYDSAGIAIFHQGKVEIRRKEGKLTKLEELIGGETFNGKVGIGHTRWATHGSHRMRMLTPIRQAKWPWSTMASLKTTFPSKIS